MNGFGKKEMSWERPPRNLLFCMDSVLDKSVCSLQGGSQGVCGGGGRK